MTEKALSYPWLFHEVYGIIPQLDKNHLEIAACSPKTRVVEETLTVTVSGARRLLFRSGNGQPAPTLAVGTKSVVRMRTTCSCDLRGFDESANLCNVTNIC